MQEMLLKMIESIKNFHIMMSKEKETHTESQLDREVWTVVKNNVKTTVTISFHENGMPKTCEVEAIPKDAEREKILNMKKKQLEDAINDQDFEKAALVRDEIKELMKPTTDEVQKD